MNAHDGIIVPVGRKNTGVCHDKQNNSGEDQIYQEIRFISEPLLQAVFQLFRFFDCIGFLYCISIIRTFKIFKLLLKIFFIRFCSYLDLITITFDLD